MCAEAVAASSVGTGALVTADDLELESVRSQGQYYLSNQLRAEIARKQGKPEDNRHVQALATRQAREQAQPWKSVVLINDLTKLVADRLSPKIRKEFFRSVNLMQVLGPEDDSDLEPAQVASSSSRRSRSRSPWRSSAERPSSSSSSFAPKPPIT